MTPQCEPHHITAIRKKLGEHGALIQTVRGVGYKASATQPSPADR